MNLDYKVFSGLCADESCRTKLYFPVHKAIIECPNCGQHHPQEKLRDISEVTNAEEAITQLLKSMVWDAKMPKKGSDTVKVNGLSNYHCKLLSPFFSRYGMDKEGNPRLLSELGHGDIADSGRLLSHRAFLIAPEHIEITGYGRDQSGSVQYLEGLLDIIKQCNGEEERLLPIHADGDGHCLVHALSRATTGREIFWHALRENLVCHLKKNLETYKNLFKDFIDQDDWKMIIDEADPYHTSPEGFNVGLGNIHIFALANVLRRPIVLLDSLKGMKNVADYTAIFVPALVEPSECQGSLPLCIAWSGSSHNHFVPLVGVAGRPLPTIPQPLIPNIWGIGRTQGMAYLNFNNDGSLTVAGGKPLQRGYLLRLVSAMEKVFLEHHSVAAKLVADMLLYVYRRVGFVELHPDIATEQTRVSAASGKIFRCLVCNALSLANVDEASLKPGGYLFKVMIDSHGSPRTGVVYNFPLDGIQCKYDPNNECLVPIQLQCSWCGIKGLRKVDRFGNTLYENGDCTPTPADIPGQCCGFKHYWDGKEYENIPKQFTVNITMQGKEIQEQVTWFFGDSNPELNSSSKDIATKITEKCFGPENPYFDEYRNKILAVICSRVEEMDLTYDERGRLSDGEPMEFDSKPRQAEKRSHQKRKANTPSKDIRNPKYENRTSTMHGSDIPSTSKAIDNGRIELKSIATSPQKIMVETALNAGLKSEEQTTQEKTVKIRVTTSDGRQETMNVDMDLDYIGLQNTVQKHFGISPIRQVLKVGFPLKALDLTQGKIPIGLRNGDRVVVEIKPILKTERKETNSIQDVSLLKKGFHRQGIDNSDGTLKGFADLLQSNRNKGLESTTNVDAGLAAVAKMAEVTGKSEWEYAINHPELFRSGGAFYGQFSRDIGLVNGRHCMLPMLPGRVFCYNGGTDQIDLCLEPVGHFPISPRVAKLSATKAESSSSPSVGKIQEHHKDSKTAETNEGEKDDKTLSQEETDESQPMEVDQDDLEEQTDPHSATSTTSKLSNQKTENHKEAKKESKIAPGFTTLGPEPTQVSQQEAESKRQELLKFLSKSKKHVES